MQQAVMEQGSIDAFLEKLETEHKSGNLQFEGNLQKTGNGSD